MVFGDGAQYPLDGREGHCQRDEEKDCEELQEERGKKKKQLRLGYERTPPATCSHDDHVIDALSVVSCTVSSIGSVSSLSMISR